MLVQQLGLAFEESGLFLDEPAFFLDKAGLLLQETFLFLDEILLGGNQLNDLGLNGLMSTNAGAIGTVRRSLRVPIGMAIGDPIGVAVNVPISISTVSMAIGV